MQRNYSFYNIPEKYGLQDYKKAQAYIIKRYSKAKGLVSIYNWGAMSEPGISDMDFIFVFDMKKAKAMPIFKRSFYVLDSSVRYMARHPFFYIDSSSFADLRYVYPDANFELIYGQEAEIKKLSRNDSFFSRIALLNDIVLRHYPRDFIEQIANKSINVRDSLLRLSSLKYSISSLELLTKQKNSWEKKLKQIAELKKDWFSRKDYGLLVGLCNDAIGISMEIIERFRYFLVNDKLIKIKDSGKVEYNGLKNKALFVKDWEKESALREMRNSASSLKDFRSIMPIEFAPQLLEYSKHKGIISNYIRKHLRGSIDFKIKHKKIAEKRISIFNSQAELAHKLRHSDFAAFFDFGYKSSRGINNVLLNIARKYRN